MSRADARARPIDGVRIVALLKLSKVVLLIVTAYGARRLLDPALAARLAQWSGAVTDRFERNLLLQALAWVNSLDVSRVNELIYVTSAYTAFVLTEACGLWWRRRWAEWMTTVATAALIPFEVWKLIMHANGRALLLLAVLIVNVMIVLYLGAMLRRTRH